MLNSWNWFASKLPVFLFLFWILSPSLPAWGQSTYVIPADYDTIQEAIDVAEDGDTISVEPGLYQENLDFLGKALSLISCEGATETTILGDGATLGDDFRSVLYLGGGDDVFVDGFEITLGFGTVFTTTAGEMLRFGGGVYVVDATLELANCSISDNSNGGILGRNSSMDIHDCVIEGNTLRGGVVGFEGSSLVLDGCVVENNSGTFALAGGVGITDAGSAAVYDCVIADNDSVVCGGMVLFGPSEVTGTEFSNNSSTFGAGGLWVDAEAAGVVGTIAACSFIGNSSLEAGGLMIGAGEWTVSDSIFVGNDGGNGSAIQVYAEDLCTIARCTVVDNTSPLPGAIRCTELGIPAPTPEIELENCIVWGNGAEPLQEEFGSIEATYCNIEGGWIGVGNIDDDPLFVDPLSGDYSLSAESPSIDAGDPDEVDPDGTIRDQGAIYFSQSEIFLRGDVDGNGTVSALIDALAVLDWAFTGGEAPGCADAADVDDSGEVAALVDSLALLLWGFVDGDPPPAPGPDECGFDPDFGTDGLECEVESACP